MERKISRFFSILLVICMVLSMMPVVAFAAMPSVLYLKPNSEWLTANARFAAYFFQGNNYKWVGMTDSDGDGYYEVSVPSGYDEVIFVRMNPSTSDNLWDNKWNQTGDLSIPTNGNNCYTMTAGSWEKGTWSAYGCAHSSHSTSGVCTTCGETVSHSWANGQCGVCGKTCSHSWSGGKCSTCGTTCSHSYDSGTVTKDPTCSAAGTKTYTCGTCGNKKTESIAATGHTYTSTVTAPTCTTGGYTTYTCSTCGNSYTGDAVAALGHTWSGGACTGCGTTCAHSWNNGACAYCGKACAHTWAAGKCQTCSVSCSHSYVNGTCSVCGKTSGGTTIHLVNTLGWDGVIAYAWEINGSSTTPLTGYEWPGQVVSLDHEGYYTLTLDYEPTSGKSLGVLFHNWKGGQTADVVLSYATLSVGNEVWIKPSTSTNSAGKYDCTVVTAESGTLISPEINGNKVTFRYQNSSATSVYLTGSMNNWSKTANKMTKNSSGVWSVTLTLEPGVYEYKFLVNGSQKLDPCNGVVGGYDNSSIVVVPTDDVTENTGKITVVLHFYRSSGDYSGWDVWYWGNEKSGSADFKMVDGDKGRVVSFTIDGSLNSNAGYVIRKTDWSDKEFSDRFIDLSDISSGTVHYYLVSQQETGCRVLGEDAISAVKLTGATYDYSSGTATLYTSLPLSGSEVNNLSLVADYGTVTDVRITSITTGDGCYTLKFSKKLTPHEVASIRIAWNGYEAAMTMDTHSLFYSSEFASQYTYNGDDLGATWSKGSTTFKVWAPTAKSVSVKIYASGNYGTDDLVKTVTMVYGDKGVWSAVVSGNWDGYYYNYDVAFANYTTEATDPYAVSTGANGDRGMIINMDATNPDGWEEDVSPNEGMSYTDAVIYELHIREFTIDESSGVKDEWKGKYLGLTQSGTKYSGYATGLDHLKQLGVTHVQLMPAYDYNSVDEYHLEDWEQYAWGYDPKNYNVPEGSYSTDPFDGSVRVGEFKEMVQTFHENGINVVMDVVYNHAFDGGNFCYNKIVPNYFCRFYGEGNWSNGSGCGNDIASERAMARNYIVDSIIHWVEEYHIDGFRFDLVGLLDTQTINEIVDTVHAKYPYVMFYGEGWAAGGTAMESGYSQTTQGNAYQVPGFGFFNDGLRNAIAGDNGNSWGFASGSWDFADALSNYFRASNGWSTSPTQTINYVSCHDNYCLMDKLSISRSGVAWSDLVKMNNLSTAIVMMAQGVPFIYSGEELLREKKDENGNRYDNAYGTNDAINKIRWSDLVDKAGAQTTSAYYAGLVEFRKNHAALRCANGGDAWNAVTYRKLSDQTILFYINGSYNNECSDGIVIIFNASTSKQTVNLGNYVPSGYWQATVHGDKAGNTALWGLNVGSGSGSIDVEPISTTILVKGQLVDSNSVYNKQNIQCSHVSHSTTGYCTSCGVAVQHTYSNGTCTGCGKMENGTVNTSTIYFNNSATAWNKVYVYAWNGEASYTGAWPGVAMTSVDGTVYSYDLPADAKNLIFNNGADLQTCDLTMPSASSGLNLYHSATATWKTYSADSADDPGVITLYCDASVVGWKAVYIYAWNGNTQYTGAWPGTPMTLAPGESGIYTYDLTTDATNVIFNNGSGVQTSNLLVPSVNTGFNMYCPDDGSWTGYSPTSVAWGLRDYTTAANTISHYYEDEIIPPTCEEAGYITHTCTDCYYSYDDSFIDATGHSYDTVVVRPTTSNDGYTSHTCGNCGDCYKENVISSDSVFVLDGANMVLGGTLSMNFFIRATNLSGTDYYAEITHYTEDGAVTTTIPYSQWESRDPYMVVTLTGLAARQMSDLIEVVIYHGDGLQAGVLWSDSVRGYAMRILENQKKLETKTMLVDMLNYGAAAQIFFNYNTDELANALLTEAQQAYATQEVNCADQRVKGTNYYGSSLILKDRIMLTMYFKNITTDMYAVVRFTDHKGNAHEIRVESSEFAKNGVYYGVVIDDLVVADGDQLVSVKVYDANGREVASASDTVNSYAVRMSGGDLLYDAVMKFTSSAYAYFH